MFPPSPTKPKSTKEYYIIEGEFIKIFFDRRSYDLEVLDESFAGTGEEGGVWVEPEHVRPALHQRAGPGVTI